jgi:superoxide dismutase, Fe-Mn family
VEPADASIMRPELPYDFVALEPAISREALEIHFRRFHCEAYEQVLAGVRGSALQGYPLAALVRELAARSPDRALLRCAEQAWSHEFFWQSMCPGGGGRPSGLLEQAIHASYRSFDTFLVRFRGIARRMSGNGWLWITWCAGRVQLVASSDSDPPTLRGHAPLLVLDLCEHAYYLDYYGARDMKMAYVDTFLGSLANWDFAASQLRRIVEFPTWPVADMERNHRSS